MLHLRLSADHDDADRIGRRLEALEGVTRVLAAESPTEECVVLTADVEPVGADVLLDVFHDLGVTAGDYRLTRLDIVAPITPQRLSVASSAEFAWLEILGEARVNSRPLARYVIMMAVAGTLAALGVIGSNAILIVGAMAVSPDLLPVCALSVGVVARRSKLIRAAAGTLATGLGLAALAAAVLTYLLGATGILESGFSVADSSIQPLAAVTDYSTVLVALAAGVAAMIAFETRASAAVGVAISVTTIPASAYLGVAFGNGEAEEGLGALLVLAVNVTLLIVSATLTLALQRLAVVREERRRAALKERAAPA